MDKVEHFLSIVFLFSLIVTGCASPTPEVIERTVRETVVVTHVVAATSEPMPIATPEPSPKPTLVPTLTPNPAVESLQELVAAVIARTGYVYAEAKGKAASFYVILIDENVRAKLVAYQAARDGLTLEQQARLLQELEARLEERNELPLLLYVQPAEGTSLVLSPVRAGPIDAVDTTVAVPAYLSDDEVEYTAEDASPLRFDSIFRKEINGDAIGLYYFQRLRKDGQPYLDAERDPIFKVCLGGHFVGVKPSIPEVLDPYSNPGGFGESCYIDLLPTELSLALLPDVVAEYVVGTRPNPPPRSEMGVNVQWDLSASDILTIVDILLTLLALA